MASFVNGFISLFGELTLDNGVNCFIMCSIMKVKTIKVRVKDKHCLDLLKQSQQVNDTWNYVNALSSRAIRERGLFLSGYDLQKYTAGASKEFKVTYPNAIGIPAQTIAEVCAQYAQCRIQFKKAKLRFRKTFDKGRALGWVPFKGGNVQWRNGQVLFKGNYYSVFDSYGLSQYEFRAGSFNEDSRGRWYFNVMVEAKPEKTTGTASIGIDLGCKTAATPSRGKALKGRWYRELETKLADAQRRRKKRQVKTIHAKIRNQRADALHKYSRKLVNENAAIFVGDVNSSQLAKTKMAKSVLDAGWYELKRMLKYKSDNADIHFEVVNEAYTTQTCNSCGEIPESSPKGKAGLSVRNWTCNLCNATHKRDVNAAKNIERLGLQSLSQAS